MLLIGNGNLITRDPEAPFLMNGGVAISKNEIVEINSTDWLRSKYPQATFVDAGGGVIMPGLINTHMHCYSSFARGMDLKAQSPHEFNDILTRLWWRLDKTLTLDDVYYSAAVAMINCIQNGTTTIFDHHASPGCVRGSLFRLAECEQRQQYGEMAKADMEFHEHIMKKSGNSRLLKAWKTIASQMQVLLTSIDFYSLSSDYAQKNHMQILNCLKHPQEGDVSQLIKEHILTSRKLILERMK